MVRTFAESANLFIARNVGRRAVLLFPNIQGTIQSGRPTSDNRIVFEIKQDDGEDDGRIYMRFAEHIIPVGGWLRG